MAHPIQTAAVKFTIDDETADNGYLYVDVDDLATVVIRRDGERVTAEIYGLNLAVDEPLATAAVPESELRLHAAPLDNSNESKSDGESCTGGTSAAAANQGV